MRLTVFALLAIAAYSAEPRITFSKSFPGSVPAFESVSIDRTGALTYQESEKDDQPVHATLEDSDTAQLFDLASKLGFFHDQLESGLKVANTGKKIFRYEDENGAASQVTFNYSVNPSAQQLLNRLEQIAESERAFLELDRTAHFDKLGVNDALAAVESLWLRKELAAPKQFLPLLNRIANHEAYMHMARDRAARLRDAIQAPPAQAVESRP